MTEKVNILVLTDHTNHSPENSLYPFLNKMIRNDQVRTLQVASRGRNENGRFFAGHIRAPLNATNIVSEIEYSKESHFLEYDIEPVDLDHIDLVWLRLPPPITLKFARYLEKRFEHSVVINNPVSIYQTGSKRFLTNFKTISPPMKVCNSLKDIEAFRKNFPIVLKPFRGYGGQGILKIEGDTVWKGDEMLTFETFAHSIRDQKVHYLAVKYLKNVHLGDKRIIVVNGKIMGASLRIPATGSWLCNVSKGGTSNKAKIEPEEKLIVSEVDKQLSKLGIVMYGIDTLVGDHGKRLLSEINTTSIGGLPQVAKLVNKPLVEEAVDLMLKYYKTHKAYVER